MLTFNLKYIIKGYFQWAQYYLDKSYRKKINVEAKKRMDICKKCEFLNKTFGTCNLCGCVMSIKTKGSYDIYEGLAVFKKTKKEIEYACLAKKW
jgi:hypothetical protein